MKLNFNFNLKSILGAEANEPIYKNLISVIEMNDASQHPVKMLSIAQKLADGEGVIDIDDEDTRVLEREIIAMKGLTTVFKATILKEIYNATNEKKKKEG